MLKDPLLKRERGYTNGKSFVRPDGSEVLAGEDWTLRKRELWERAKGRCEFTYRDGSRCREEAADAHHILRRWPRRDDRLANLEALCRRHHDLYDPRKLRPVSAADLDAWAEDERIREVTRR